MGVGEVKDQHYFRHGVVIVCADAQSCGWNATVCCQMTCWAKNYFGIAFFFTVDVVAIVWM